MFGCVGALRAPHPNSLKATPLTKYDVAFFVKRPRLRALGPFPVGKGPSASKLRARERREWGSRRWDLLDTLEWVSNKSHFAAERVLGNQLKGYPFNWFPKNGPIWHF